MMKVLIIDSNEERTKSLIAKLSEKEIMTYSASDLDGIANFTQVVDILVLLDQADQVAKRVVERISADHELLVLTNLKEIEHKTNRSIVYFDQINNLEYLLINKINEIVNKHTPFYLSPIAQDPNSKVTLEIARKAAKSQATVLITGETGVGKEVLAQYIHQHSLVSKGPFVSVNCAALPDNMIEAILFGYEKGAFTSAITSYIGKFEQAQNGTLLLDEISEISIGLQAKLLRVLQEREVERLGGKKTINVNVRIIAATNRNLAEQVKQGSFRKDLYYRLSVIPIHCAALRERPLDILPLADFCIHNHAKSLGRKIAILTNNAKNKLINHRWPGNIREMDNVIQRAMIMTDSDILNENDIQLTEEILESDSFNSKLEASEAKIIIDILNEVDGCRNSAAKKLNMSPRTLRYKLAKLRSIGLKVPNKISREDSYDH